MAIYIILEQRIRSFEYEETLGLRKQFLSNGFVRVKGLVPAGTLEEIDEECSRIMQILGSDKDLLMEETQNTPRHMRTVGQHRLAQESSLIPSIYESDIFRGFLIAIAGQELFKAPWLPEQYILSHLYREGDTHGWHWDDYTFASVIYIKSPSIDQGGFVQTCANGHWDKKNPKVYQTLLNSPINTYRCEAGDAYLLRAKDYLHRVTPVQNGGERLIVNMTWASEFDLATDMTHATNDILFTDKHVTAQ